ncbi:alcohol-forming fatty acyl-CoA reductase [Sarotherodon galilaeus]
MLKLIMVLLWMILLVVLLCAEAENVTEVREELGTNVTLTCSNQTSDTHWYMEIYSQFRACIGRDFSSAGSTFCSPGFETKFSILGNKLMIKNLTAEDCRLYFCGIKRDGSIRFVETFHLISDVTQKPVALTDSNQQSELVILSSLSLNAALILVVICLSCVSLSLKRRISKYQANLPPAGTSERLETPQKEIQPPPRSAVPPSEGIYYKLHLPCFTLPQS